MFYVYELCEENGKPFYVGKGKAGRWNAHEKLARRGFTYRVHNKIRKLWREGRKIQRRVVFETLDESLALAKEKELIARYGIENLTNMTTGGDGVRFTPELRQKIGVALKGKPKSEIAKQRMREAKVGFVPWNVGIPRTVAERAKISASKIGKPTGRCWNKGMKYSVFTLRGKAPWNKGKTNNQPKKSKSRRTKINMIRGACLRWLMESVQRTGYCGA